MASSSSSSLSSSQELDVYVSFRGEYTRKTFISQLYSRSNRGGILTYKDGMQLKKEKKRLVVSDLLEAIGRTRVAVVVMSEDYASSRWCLDELAMIMECQEKGSLKVIPVFYKVDPSDVRKQTGKFAWDLEKHEERETLEKVQRWRDAMTKVAYLCGLSSQEWADDASLIDELTKTISDVLMSSALRYSRDLIIGLDDYMREMNVLLSLESNNEVRMIAIWGMGGVGKTTLARCVYEQISKHFEAHRFVENVKRIYRDLGPSALQMEILLENPQEKALLVADDLDEVEQLEALSGMCSRLGLGSRVIVITRDRELLAAFGVEHVYEVKPLSYHKSLQLFSKFAFTQKHPPYPPYGFIGLSGRAVKLAKGLPLALKLLGSCLYGRGVKYWEYALDLLEATPSQSITEVLEISYDSLDEQWKGLFLLVASLFNGVHVDHVITLVDDDNQNARTGIEVLIEKCLINVRDDGCVYVHDFLQQLVHKMVYLHCYQMHKSGDAHQLKYLRWERLLFYFRPDSVSPFYLRGKMERRRLENLRGGSPSCRLLKIDRPYYPFALESRLHRRSKILPHCTGPRSMEYLELNFSLGLKLRGIRELTLSLKRVQKLPESIGHLSCLESLKLWNCELLVSLPDTIGDLTLLNFLLLCDCHMLQSIPETVKKLESLEIFCVLNGTKISEFPRLPENVIEVYFTGTAIKQIPSWIVNFCVLERLNISYSDKLKFLPASIYQLQHLQWLDLQFCPSLDSFPVQIYDTTGISEELGLDEKSKQRLSPLSNLDNLKYLSISRTGKSGGEPFPLPPLSNFPSLGTLKLSNLNMLEISNDLAWLTHLCYLDLSGNDFKKLPVSIKRLSSLHSLCIRDCKNLHSLPTLPPGMRTLLAHGCVALASTLQGLGDTLEILVLSNCFRLARVVDLFSMHMDFLPRGSLQFLCLPGSRVPRFFSHQKEGYFLTVSLPSRESCSELVGFSACIVVHAQGLYCIDSFEIRWTCGTFNGDFAVDIFSGVAGLRDAGVATSGSMKIKSDHVFLFNKYLKWMCNTAVVFDRVEFEFYCKDRRATRDLQVKECGVCLLFQNELEKSKGFSLADEPLELNWDGGNLLKHVEREKLEVVQSSEDRLIESASIPEERSLIWEEGLEVMDEFNDNISKPMISTPPSETSGLVGMDVHMDAMLGLLELESTNEIRMIGIWGAGGVGKTTLARYVYEQMSPCFQSYCFLENIKKIDQEYGLTHLQQELSKNLQGALTTRSSDMSSGDLKARLTRRRVLVVADDVDRDEQLNVVAKEAHSFGPGSRVIVTTRDKGLLGSWGIQHIYEVECLGHSEALQLFSQYAFIETHPSVGFEQLSDRAVKLADGLPLALKLLGSFFRDKGKDDWERSLHRLEASSDQAIVDRIKISPNELDEEDKSVTGSISSEPTSPGTSDCYSLVAMDRHMKAMHRLLDLDSSNDVRKIGILGVEGVGKMTLARYVYEEISPHFQNHCFLKNVKKIYQEHGPSGLQEEFLLKDLRGDALKIRNSIVGYNDVKARLGDRKVLLVIDAVDKIEQVEAVAKEANWFGGGSRVIITANDKSLLVSCGVEHVYELEGLRFDEALQLFCQCAFRQDYPSDGFEQLSVRAVYLVGRLPLGLKVLGSFLNGKSEDDWENALRGLEASFDEDTLEMLKSAMK